MWEPATAAPGGSASHGAKVSARPTPTTEIDQGQSAELARHSPSLSVVALHGTWATPEASMGKRGDRAEYLTQHPKAGNDLMTQTMNWPTPTSRDYRSPNAESYEERGGGTKGEQLQNYVAHHFCSPQDQQTPAGQESSPPTRTSPLRLNPLFVGWLMGWPSTWTIAEPHASSAAATVLWRSRLQQHLLFLLGEQAFAANDPEPMEEAA